MRSGMITRASSKGTNHLREHPYILTIIDMQEHFTTAHNPRTLKNVIHLVRKAISDHAYIIVAQYRRSGKTLEPIRGLIRLYRHHSYAIADHNDKSGAIYRKLLLRGQSHIPKMFICGVNLDACVHDTVWGLHNKYFGKICIISDACNSNYPGYENSFLMKMSGLRRVIIDQI